MKLKIIKHNRSSRILKESQQKLTCSSCYDCAVTLNVNDLISITPNWMYAMQNLYLQKRPRCSRNSSLRFVIFRRMSSRLREDKHSSHETIKTLIKQAVRTEQSATRTVRVVRGVHPTETGRVKCCASRRGGTYSNILEQF